MSNDKTEDGTSRLPSAIGSGALLRLGSWIDYYEVEVAKCHDELIKLHERKTCYAEMVCRLRALQTEMREVPTKLSDGVSKEDKQHE